MERKRGSKELRDRKTKKDKKQVRPSNKASSGRGGQEKKGTKANSSEFETGKGIFSSSVGFRGSLGDAARSQLVADDRGQKRR